MKRPGDLIVPRKHLLYAPFTPVGIDDEFDDNLFSDWTSVQEGGGPSLTLIERNDHLSILHPGGDGAAEFHAWMRPYTPAAGNYIEMAVSVAGFSQNYNIAGLIFSDGVTWGSGEQMIWYWSAAESGVTQSQHINFNTSQDLKGAGYSGTMRTDMVFIRYRQVDTNASPNWEGFVSVDGIQWAKVRGPGTQHSITPTHVGFGVTTWGGGSPCTFAIHYFKQGNV